MKQQSMVVRSAVGRTGVVVVVAALATLGLMASAAPAGALLGAGPVAVACSPAALVEAMRGAEARAGADVLALAPGCVYGLARADNDGANGPNGLPVVRGV